MNNIQIASDNARLFKEGAFDGMTSEYISDFTPIENPHAGKFDLAAHTVKQTTVECIISNREKDIIALNFANAVAAGGGYLIGANAQEESLCRAGGLYYTIKECKAFYSANRRHIIADYTDGMIYSQNVPVVRNDSGDMLDSPIKCSFITCPAVNRYEAFMIPGSRTNLTMQRRIEEIVSFAAEKSHGLVILGAFGCGAFGNRREEILPMFVGAIEKYGGQSAEYIFAIP